ncbi:MAG: FGGY-family carbohydrate kinase [Devosia sp.]
MAIGIDIGTSGVRASAIDASQQVLAHASAVLPPGDDAREPHIWLQAMERVLLSVLSRIEPVEVRAIAVDGTSGTCLAIDRLGSPIGRAAMYYDQLPEDIDADRFWATVPTDSAARSATSPAGKALALLRHRDLSRIVHQADWLSGCLSGQFEVTDENNALKTGYDPVSRRWPDWLETLGLDIGLLPRVVEPGTVIGTVTTSIVDRLGLSPQTLVVAGTTDGCASFMATGAAEIGDGVTALGSTLTIKLLTDRPVTSPRHGIYSHRLFGKWLAGGASNSGGKALAQHFSTDELVRLSSQIDPAVPSALDYYPLPRPGERFPISDPNLAPRAAPRPDNDVAFLHGLLEGIARIEALGYRTLADLGAHPLKTLRTVGGGAHNKQWAEMRHRLTGAEMRVPLSDDAAVGVARLALIGADLLKDA